MSSQRGPTPNFCTAELRRGLRLVVSILLFFSTQNIFAGSVEVITHADRAMLNLDRNLLRGIFTMRIREWPDHHAARVFVLADDSQLHDLFCREQLGTYPYVLRSAWDRMVFTGTGLAPTPVASESEMKKKVESTPGAIGYVSSTRHSFLPAYLSFAANTTSGEPGHD